MGYEFYSWSLGIGAIVGLILNSIVIFDFVYRAGKRRFKKEANFSKLLISLATADAIFCSGGISLLLHQLGHTRSLRTAFEVYWTISQGVSFASAVLHVTAISSDRFIGIVHPLRYKCLVTNKRLRVLLLLIWLASISLAMLQFGLPHAAMDALIAVLIASSFAISSVTYAVIGRTIQKKHRLLKSSCRKRRTFKPLIMCGIITLTFFVFNVPFAVATAFYSQSKRPWSPTVAYVIYLLMTVNCIVHPLVYSSLAQFWGTVSKLTRMSPRDSCYSERNSTLIRLSTISRSRKGVEYI